MATLLRSAYKSKSVSFAYPIMLDLTGRRAVIIGGGTVAARKAQALLDAGCTDIVVVAPDFSGKLPPAVQKIAKAYDPQHLVGAFLVFAATDSTEVNEKVVLDAQKLNLLVSRADFDEAANGNFSSPAAYRAGLVVISVSAAGAPSLSAEIRDRLTKKFPKKYTAMAAAMQSIRPAIRTRIPNPEQRRTIFRDLASADALAILDRYGNTALWAWLIKKYPMLK